MQLIVVQPLSTKNNTALQWIYMQNKNMQIALYHAHTKKDEWCNTCTSGYANFGVCTHGFCSICEHTKMKMLRGGRVLFNTFAVCCHPTWLFLTLLDLKPVFWFLLIGMGLTC